MIVLLDVDGVLADFCSHLLGKVQPYRTRHEVTSFDILDGMSSEERRRALLHLDSYDFWQDMPLIPGAKFGVDEFVSKGYEVVFVTSPWLTCVGWGHARRAWLQDNFGHHETVITSAKYRVEGDVFVDDRPEHVKKWAAAHPSGQALLYDASYNQGPKLYRMSWTGDER